MSRLDDGDENYRAWQNENLAAAGMLPDREERDVFRAITACIVSTGFSLGDWVRLADDIGERDGSIIEKHSRLLRSLKFGDDDYDQHVRSVIQSVMGGGFEHLGTIVNAIDLKTWLPEGDPDRNAKLYGGEGVLPSDRLQDQELAPDGVRAASARLIRLTLEHPDAVIGSSKNLVEAAAKCVLLKVAAGEPVPTKFPTLIKTAFVALALDPAAPPGPEVIHEPLRQMVQGLISSSSALAELRNTAGDGHGTTDAVPPEELREVAALIRDTAVMIANLLIHRLERRTR